MNQRPGPDEIDRIRTASRTLAREWGFLRHTLAGSDLSASAVHGLIEIGRGTVSTATGLAAQLGLEKSTVSRLVKGLVSKGLIASQPDARDGRLQILSLTGAGQQQFREIEAYARDQVEAALQALPERKRNTVAQGLSVYAAALQKGRSQTGDPGTRLEAVTLHTGYVPTLLGRVTEMHAAYYSASYNFGAVFERKVAAEMAEFLGRIERPENETFSATLNGRIVGAVTIDGEDLAPGIAHLRWFIADNGARGFGIGRRLMAAAMAFVDAQGFTETHLWTFRGLDAARRLYEDFGFDLVEEKAGAQWGTRVQEQMFVRKAPA